jgi:hypothetical protein
MATCPFDLDLLPGGASVMANVTPDSCCRAEDVPVPCSVMGGFDASSPLRVTRCSFAEGSERRSDQTMRDLRNSTCGMRAGLDLAARIAEAEAGSSSSSSSWLASAAAMLVTPAARGNLDAAQGIHVAVDASGALSTPLSMDPPAQRSGCTVAALQHAETARTFRRLRESYAARLRRDCEGALGDRGLPDTVQCARAREEISEAYARLQESTAAAADNVVRRCFPGAATESAAASAAPASPLDALAAGTFLLAARPPAPTAAHPLGEDTRACALRADVAAQLCGALPAALLGRTAEQLRTLCKVDAMGAMAAADGADDPLGAARDMLREAALADPATAPFADSAVARRWCPAMLSAAADGVDNLRARLTANPALGRADRLMCGNLLAAASCLGPGGQEVVASSDQEEEEGEVQQPAPPEQGPEGSDDEAADGEAGAAVLPDGRVKLPPPADLAAKDGTNADTVNVFADVFDPSVSRKAEAVAVLSRVVSERLPDARVERLEADEVPANTGLEAESQHSGVCFLHCHARGEEAGPGKVMNCRLFTPPSPSSQCTRAVISVADESPLPEGTDLKDRTGPAYETVRGMLDAFVGCNVSRGGTVNGVPASAANVRMEPFGSSRWQDARARYGFCYVERDQAELGPGAETESRLSNLRQPSGNYMVAFATSRARQGGRMAQRECKMLLDLQQNVCRHKWASNLDELPGYRECEDLDLVEVIGSVGVPVPLESGDTVTVYVPLINTPRKACELRKLAEACGRISNFAVGEPALRDPLSRYGVPDSNDLHCPAPTAAGAPQRGRRDGMVEARSPEGFRSVGAAGISPHSSFARAGSGSLGRQEYDATVWSDLDRSKRAEKERLDTGCEATCALYHDYTNPAERIDFMQCVARCFGELQV